MKYTKAQNSQFAGYRPCIVLPLMQNVMIRWDLALPAECANGVCNGESDGVHL